MTLSRRVCNIYRLNGLVTYEQAWKYQRALVEHTNAVRKAGKVTSDSLILLEHPSVYTLGRGATLENLKFETDDLSADHSIFRVERGGEVTWHGPGQLVVYPILDLYHHKKDLHWYSRALEEVVIKSLARFGIDGQRLDVNTGVWVGNNKISAIGITASRWITMHGCAINVQCDMQRFTTIVPCGISDDSYGVCRLIDKVEEDKAGGDSLFEDVARTYLEEFGSEFALNVQHADQRSLDEVLGGYPDIANSSLINAYGL